MPSVTTRQVQGRTKRGRIFQTNHTATEVGAIKGATLARGVLRHEPHRRAADHRRVKLDGWHLLVKNTVPVG